MKRREDPLGKNRSEGQLRRGGGIRRKTLKDDSMDSVFERGGICC